jgi:hypothetical protein
MCHNKEEIHDAVKAKVHELDTRGIRYKYGVAVKIFTGEPGTWYGDGAPTRYGPAHLPCRQIQENNLNEKFSCESLPNFFFSAPFAHVDAYHAPQ